MTGADRDHRHTGSAGTWLSRIARGLVAVVFLAASGGLAAYWLTHRPKATRRRPPAQAFLVEAMPVQCAPHQVVVRAMGTVVPAREMELAARVGGRIVELGTAFLPGGTVRSGDVLLRIDPVDYELALRRQQAEVARRQADLIQRQAELSQRDSDVTRAESDLALEMGQQAVARGEYDLLGMSIDEKDRPLVLRQPQLQMAQATLASAKAAKESADASRAAAVALAAVAEADVEQARLNRSRTEVAAPFNAMIRTRHVNLGSEVNAGTALASLVGTDEYWVEVSLPVDELKWVHIPQGGEEEGSPVRIYYESAWGGDVWRAGTVRRLLADVEPQGRMARLLIGVPDPLDLEAADRHPLLLGAFVRVAIQGRTLERVASIPRTALHDGRHVWLIGADDALEVRELAPVWTDREQVYLAAGLEEGDRVVLSNIGAPVPGMALRTAPAANAPTEASGTRGAPDPSPAKPGEPR